MLHNHGDVVGSQAVLGQRSAIVSLDSGSGLGLLGRTLLGELLRLLHLHLAVEILQLQLAEDSVRSVQVEHLGVVDDEDEAVTLLQGDASDTAKSLHADLGEGLAALLLVAVELVGAGTLLLLELGHLVVGGFLLLNFLGHSV